MKKGASTNTLKSLKCLPTFSTSSVPCPIFINLVKEKNTIKIQMFDIYRHNLLLTVLKTQNVVTGLIQNPNFHQSLVR